MEALLAIGWVRVDAEEALVVPPGRYFTMAEVRLKCSCMSVPTNSWLLSCLQDPNAVVVRPDRGGRGCRCA